jgi:hypothetical protein
MHQGTKEGHHMSKALDTAIATMHSRKATSSDYLKPKATKHQPIGIFTEDGLDQTVYSEGEARRELKDLKGMGFMVKAIKVSDFVGAEGEHSLDAIHELIRDFGRFPGAARLSKVASEFGVTLTTVKG